ncbi:hypothetical protein LJR186_000861 [Microbacterium foliorum]
MTAVLALTVAVATTRPAEAASKGPGYGTWDDRIGRQGGFVAPDGSIVYCIEPGVSNPSGNSTSGGLQTSVVSRTPYGDRTLTSDDLARINFLVTTYGQTADNRESSSAVNFAVKYIANPAAMFHSHSWNGSWDPAEYVNWVLFSTVGADEASAVASRAQTLIDAASTVTAGSSVGGSGSLTFQVDPFNNYLGTITMVGTAGSVGTVTLGNGVFTTTGSKTPSGMRANTPYPVTGVPPTEDGAPYKISGSGTFTIAGSGWAGSAHIWTTGSQQTNAGPGPRVNLQFPIAGSDPLERSVLFAPVVSTEAVAYAQPGGYATDTLPFRTTALDGLNNPWPQTGNGGYRVVQAEGTLYGPFTDQPAESDIVPEDAPVVGHATVTTATAAGPTAPYTVTSDSPVDAAGYYTWGWTIDAEMQSAATRAYLPDGYSFTDRFGQPIETTIKPMQFAATTQVVEEGVMLSGPAADTAEAQTDGMWLQRAGRDIPVVVRWDAYFDPAAAADFEQVPGTDIPERATHLGTVTDAITANFTVTTPTDLESGAIQVPVAASGSIVWVFSVLRADQDENAGYVADFVDDYGVPPEISAILQPEVVTTHRQVRASARRSSTRPQLAVSCRSMAPSSRSTCSGSP